MWIGPYEFYLVIIYNFTVLILLGFYDNDTSNDLTARNGTVIPSDSPESKIYYDFGDTCK